MTARGSLKTGAEEVRWDLSDFFAGPDDPGISAMLKNCLARAMEFEADTRGKVGRLDAAGMAGAMGRLESISEDLGRVLSYAQLLFAADTIDPKIGGLFQSSQERATEIRRHLIFFDLEWLAVPDDQAARLLEDSRASRYRHFMETMRRFKPHRLSEPEEKILDLKAVTGANAFSRLFDEVTSAIRFPVRLEGKTRRLSEEETLALLHDADRETRRAAARGMTRGLRAHSRILSLIFNTLVLDHAGDDLLRSFPGPMDSRHLANEIRAETVEALLSTVEKNYGMVRKYYGLKRRLLGLESLKDYDRYAPLSRDDSLTRWKEAEEIVLDAYAAFSPRAGKIAKEFFHRRWIDAGIRNGKQGGAFSSGTVPSAHPLVFLNYTGRRRDVMTLAHELGHGIHQYLSRDQGIFHADTPLTTAETASVFGEMLVFHRLKRAARDPRERLSLLCGKIEDSFATVFRQAAMTRFEQALHENRRTLGELSADQIGALWMKANRAMFGDSVVLTKDYAAWWLYIPHFVHSPFYCYAYVFGELLTLALYKKYQIEKDGFVPKYIDLLSAGGSDSPDRLLQRIGVDVNRPAFWQGGLDLLGEMVDEAEELGMSIVD